jgi:4-hydroxy-3-methylbut-2-enyl diphosphate reductase
MKIIVPKPHGFCFGVERAIKLAENSVKEYKGQIYILGELVHNQHVIDYLEQKLQLNTVSTLDEVPDGSVLILRAHGSQPSLYEAIKKKNLTLVDATCPLVTHSHHIAKELIKKNKKIIFLCSSPTHDEVVGVVGESPENITPITLTDIFDYQISDPKNYAVLTQTTLSTLETAKAIEFLKSKYSDLSILPHICAATTERQQAIIDQAKIHKFVVIVGAQNSANSQSLFKVATSVGATAYIVDNESELNPDWFIGKDTVVISSGASTPESVLDAVIKKIESFTRL